MGALILAGLSAIAYGASDFVGGLRSRSVHYIWVTFFTQVIIAIGISAWSLARPGTPTAADLGWALVSAIGTVFGTLMLMRGFSRGAMHVVGPLSAVTGAALPVIVGLALGERPTPLSMLGIVAALPAVWLVASAPDASAADPAPAADAAASRTASRDAALDGLLAGLGFALYFISIAQFSDAGGGSPLIVMEALSLVLLGSVVAVVRPPGRFLDARGAWPMALLSIAATVCYALATQQGLLSLVAVVTSLYPALTVALAAVVLHERPSGRQVLGLVLAGLAVVLIALGGR